tara:strand:+ start:64 stop:402 length:339 start_codon:yes stop_codon:yes gene_type:complete
MNLPPVDINVDAARMNELGPSSYQENQAVNQTLKTQEVRNEISNNQDTAALQEVAKRNALRDRQEQQQAATLDMYYVAEAKKLAGITPANSKVNELAAFAAKYPDAIRALLS